MTSTEITARYIQLLTQTIWPWDQLEEIFAILRRLGAVEIKRTTGRPTFRSDQRMPDGVVVSVYADQNVGGRIYTYLDVFMDTESLLGDALEQKDREFETNFRKTCQAAAAQLGPPHMVAEGMEDLALCYSAAQIAIWDMDRQRFSVRYEWYDREMPMGILIDVEPLAANSPTKDTKIF